MDAGEEILGAVAAETVAAEVAHAGAHSLPVGTPCPNCATPLLGGWCHACGQKAEKYDRSIGHLIAEVFEGLTHLDGRVWQTLPRLVINPGQLTRDYLDGHRAVQIPPFRMFLVVLLLVFFSGQLNFQANHVHFKFAPGSSFIARDPADRAAFGEAAEALRAKPSARWMIEGAEKAVKDPEAMVTAMEHWTHQFAILLLPIAALLLAPMFAFRKGVYVFDHLVFAMHSLSFQGLLITAMFLAGLLTPWATALLLIAPVHLFAHMRRAYGIGVGGTLVRMSLLFVGSAAGFIFLMIALLFVGFATIH